MINILKHAVNYSTDRVSIDKLNLSSYISTDNLVQNKLGKTDADKLPSHNGKVTGFIENDILVANIRPYLKKIWYANMCGGSSSDVLTFRVKDTYIPKFVYYAIFRDEFFAHMMNGSKGTKMPRGDKTQILNFPIPFFEKKEQKKIATVLSILDKKIELNNKINSELEPLAKLIYDYWFVQFDFPDANGKPYKSSGGKMVYNETLNREIPVGWEVGIIGNILSTDLGGTPSTQVNEYWGGDIPWLNSGEIANFPIIEAEEHITSDAIEKSATSLMPKGTCVLSITRHLRPSILAVEACANQSVVGIYESEKLKATFLYPYLKNEIPRLMSLRTGAQQPHINKRIVDESLIVVPSNETLNIYYERVKGIYDQIYNNAFQIKELVELRDWLLPMLMNGQVTVKERVRPVDQKGINICAG
jgi:type I restriction enzyme S subunit